MMFMQSRTGGKTLPILAILASVLGLAGCVGHGARWVEPESGPKRREASRKELLGVLEQQMNRLATLSAKVNITIVKQDILLPASVTDDLLRVTGKPYHKRFLRGEVTGLLFLSRAPDGSRKIRFSGEVTGASAHFLLLGKNNDFWVVPPDAQDEKDKDKKDASRGRVFVGTVDRRGIRPNDLFSVRPQDVEDMLLNDEVYSVLHGEMICFVETWPDYYVMNFIRPDWPENLYSRIWIERVNGTVAIHQLFDGSGNIVAEGRFRDYKEHFGKGSSLTADIPVRVDFLWPRDQLILQCELSNIKVNEQIRSDVFEPKLTGYKEVRVPATAEP